MQGDHRIYFGDEVVFWDLGVCALFYKESWHCNSGKELVYLDAHST